MMWLQTLAVVTLAGAGLQLPPSIIKSAPHTDRALEELSAEDRKAACQEVQYMAARLGTDRVWNQQPLSDRELARMNELLAKLKCGGEPPGFEGTWKIAGVRRGSWAGPLPEGSLTVRRATDAEWQAEVRQKWGAHENWACQQKPPDGRAYIGTIQWDPGSFFAADAFCWYRDRGAPPTGTVLLCETQATKVIGRFRDAQQMRGGSLDLFIGDTVTGTLVQDCQGPTDFSVTLTGGAKRP